MASKVLSLSGKTHEHKIQYNLTTKKFLYIL